MSTAPSGIACYGELEWGAHFCHFYETRDDLVDTLVPFFAAGLANNEQCLWVTSEPLCADAATEALTAHVPELADHIARGQIQIVDYTDWYTRSGELDSDAVLASWLRAEQDALARGFTGLRVTGNVTFLSSRDGWSEFERYEARVSETFAGRKLLALCSYPLGMAHACDVLDVVRNHQFALARRAGTWELLESSAMRMAKEQLRRANIELERRVEERTAALEAELRDARLLHDISAAFVEEERVDVLFQKLLDAAAVVMRSDHASMQRLERGRELQLLAHRGFTPEAAKAWQSVHADSHTACGQALSTGSRVIVRDIEQCDYIAQSDQLATFRQTGIRAIQTTPLRSRDGTLVGMISTHWKRPHEPSSRDLRLLDIIARQVADLIERHRAGEALRMQTSELLAADRRKDEFLATLAHELRNPLAPIRTGLAVMKTGAPEAIPRVVAMMDRQLGHMVRLVDDLLDVSRVSRGKVALRRERVALRTIIDGAIETSRPLIEAGNHELSVTVPGQPLWVDADTTRVAQVISNILNNAAKYTPDGGDLRLVVERDRDEVAIRIADNGIGIPREMLPKVFDLFAQVGQALERSQGGLGLGLSLAKKLVELHGGSIEAESAGLGHGATFTVRLPLAAAPSRSHASGAAAVVPAPQFRILIIDDNVDAAEMLAMLLEGAGHTTRVVTESPAAVAAAVEFAPDVVFLDIGMPILNGFEVARELRRHTELECAVLVALTGWGAEEDRERSREAGFDHHLTKPVLASTVEQLLAGLRLH